MTIVECHDPDAWEQGSDNKHYNDVYLTCDTSRLVMIDIINIINLYPLVEAFARI